MNNALLRRGLLNTAEERPLASSSIDETSHPEAKEPFFVSGLEEGDPGSLSKVFCMFEFGLGLG